MSNQQWRVYVCHGPTCAQQVKPIWQVLNLALQTTGAAERCELIVSGCQGRCDDGPNINVYPNLTKYAHVSPDGARQIVEQHVGQDQPVRELMVRGEM